MVIAPQGLRGGVDGEGPAVGCAPFIDSLPEVPNQEVTTHLQVGDGTLEVLFTALAEAGPLFQGKGEPLLSSWMEKQSMIRFWRMGASSSSQRLSKSYPSRRQLAKWGNQALEMKPAFLPKNFP